MAEVTPTMYCLKCDYVLDGLREHRCSECGQTFDPADSAGFYSPGRSRPTAVGLRRAHEVLLLIVGAVFLDRIAADYLTPLWGFFGKRYDGEVLICVLEIGATAPIVYGILLARHHRRDARLLPVLVDAVLCLLVVIAGLQLLLPRPSPGFSPLCVLYGNKGEVLGFVILVAVQSLMLVILRKRRLSLLRGLMLRSIAIIVLVLIIFVFDRRALLPGPTGIPGSFGLT